MVRMFKAHIPMTESSDVQIGSDLLDFNTSVNPTRWPIVHLVVCRTVSSLMLLGPPLLSPRE